MAESLTDRLVRALSEHDRRGTWTHTDAELLQIRVATARELADAVAGWLGEHARVLRRTPCDPDLPHPAPTEYRRALAQARVLEQLRDEIQREVSSGKPA